MNGFLGTGDLYMDRLDAAGASQGFVLAGNATRFELNVETEEKKLVSRKRGTAGQTLASVTRITATTLGLTLNELDKDVLANIFLGTATSRTAAAGTVTDEPVVARLDRWVRLAHMDVSSVVVTDATGSTTYAEGTDYEVHARLGMVKALAGGSINDGDTILVDYAYGAESGHLIAGATQPVVAVRLLLDGRNDANGKDCTVTVHEARIRPASPVDFLAEDFSELQFDAELLTPAGKSWPFEIIYIE